MIVYFTNRQLEVLGQASTSLPLGLRIIEDSTTEDVDTGCNIFTCRVHCNGNPREEVERLAQEGHFIIKGSGTSFTDKENTYDSLYQIIETEFDTLNNSVYIYAEDAGLDLINRVVGASTQSNKTLQQMLSAFVPAGWTYRLNGTPTGTKTYTWDGENTVVERIKSVANLFGCEMYYSFVIERMEVTQRVINVIPKRGSAEAVAQLRLGRDIDNIVTKKSISNLATAFSVTGGTPSNSNTPINLKGYSYTYTDGKGDKYQVDSSTGQMRNITQMQRWASVLDTDGLIVKTYSFDTTDKATLAGQARAALQKVCYPEVNYECTIINLPDFVRVGDRINVIDSEGDLYLEARVLQLIVSVSNESAEAVLGEYKIKQGGISDIVSQLATDFSNKVKNGLDSTTISVISSGGNIFHNQQISTTLTATVYCGTDAITTQSQLENIYGAGAQIRWYSLNNALLGNGFTYNLSTSETAASVLCRLYTEE